MLFHLQFLNNWPQQCFSPVGEQEIEEERIKVAEGGEKRSKEAFG